MEDTALYRPILKKAYLITKKFKNLWFFGLFAAILGTGGEYEIFIRAMSRPNNVDGVILGTLTSFKEGWTSGAALGGNFWSNFWSLLITDPLSVIGIILLLIVSITIALFFIWLTLISQIGLIRNGDLAGKNKRAGINEGIDFAVKNFWPVLLINVVLKIILFIIFLLLGEMVILLSARGAAGVAIYYLLFLIFVFIVFIISFLLRYQIFYLLLKKQKLMAALKSSWKLFVKNWLISLEMALVMFMLYIIATILTLLAGLVIFNLFFIIIFNFALPFWLFNLLLFIVFLSVIIIIPLITALLSTFQWSAWTLLFNRLTAGKGISKVIRISQQLPQLPNYLMRK